MTICPHGLEKPDYTCYDRWCNNECSIPTEKDKEITRLTERIKQLEKELADLRSSIDSKREKLRA